MKRLLAGTIVALFGLVPLVGWACEYTDASMASSTPEAKLGLAAAPAASKAPAAVVVKANEVKQVKARTDKAPARANDARVAEAPQH